MSIVFFGTGIFAIPTLEAVRSHVSLVVTQPDRPAGRGMRPQPSPVKDRALELGLEVDTPESCRAPHFVDKVAALSPDFLLVAAYGQILPVQLLERAKHGGINLHGSILPKYRGAAPIQRAILAGEKETGVTLMQMAKGMDAGDVIAIHKTCIDPDETYGELQERLSKIAAQLAKGWLIRLAAGDYPRQAQKESEASLAPKVAKQEARLDFETNAREAYNRFRAFTPAPGAFLATKFGSVKLSKVRGATGAGVPGTVCLPNLVSFVDGGLELIEVQPEGKRRMSGKDFFNGVRLRNGDSLI